MPCAISNFYQGFQVVELNKAPFLCFFFDKNDELSTSLIKKYDYDMKYIISFKVDFVEIIHANVHEDELYLLATSSDRKSKDVYVYDESFKLLEKIHLGNREGLPCCVPDSVRKMRTIVFFSMVPQCCS